MVCTIVRAHSLVGGNPSDRSPYTLADLFCRQARTRIQDRFRRLFRNSDAATYSVAQQVMEGTFDWVEEGLIKEDWIPSAAPEPVESDAPVAVAPEPQSADSRKPAPTA